MRPTVEVQMMDSNKMVDISRYFDTEVYIGFDEQYEKDVVVFRIFNGTYDGAGYSFPVDISEKIIQNMRDNNIPVDTLIKLKRKN